MALASASLTFFRCEDRQDFGTGEHLESGEFPKRALRLVLEWHDLHRTELALNWERARRREPLVPVAPLE